MADKQKLVYDWNFIGESEPLTNKRVLLDDETLRDGLQSPTVSDPPIEDKIHLLHLMEDLGIQMLDIGLPGAGPRAKADALAIAQEISRSGLGIRPNCAARTTIQDIDPILEIAVQGTDLTVGVEDHSGHWREVPEQGEIQLRVPEVRAGIDDDGPVIAADEVVLLGIAVQERRLRLWPC